MGDPKRLPLRGTGRAEVAAKREPEPAAAGERGEGAAKEREGAEEERAAAEKGRVEAEKEVEEAGSEAGEVVE